MMKSDPGGAAAAMDSGVAADTHTPLLELGADWVWELDSSYRFTRLEGTTLEGAETALDADFLGKPRWEIGYAAPDGDEEWAAHRALLEERAPFRDLVLCRPLDDGTRRFVSISGAPRYDERRRWTGYRGTGRDITDWYTRRDELLLFQAAVDGSPDPIYVVDVESLRFIYANETACRLRGITLEDHLQIRPYEAIRRTPEELREIYEQVVAAGKEGVTAEPVLVPNKDGSRKGWWEVHSRATRMNGRWVIVAASREVTRQVLAEESVARTSRMYAALSAANEAIIHTTTQEELYQAVCEAAVQAGGFATACILLPEAETSNLRVTAVAGNGKSRVRVTAMSVDETLPEGQGLGGTAFRTGQPCVTNDYQNDSRLGYWQQLAEHARLKGAAAIPIRRDDASVGVFMLFSAEKRAFDDDVISLLERITENLSFALINIEHEIARKLAEERIQYLATHDSLTALPNRVLFAELLGMALRNAERYSRTLALMFIDLDRFKAVNDTLGHEAGDTLLKVVATRLKSCVRASDVVARLGGDEFVVLLQEPHLPVGADIVAQRILESIQEPVFIDGHACDVSASIGISLYPTHALDERSLMSSADTAMYVAKENDERPVQFYSPGITTPSLARRALEQGIRTALTRDEFVLRYRVRRDLETDEATGVEALVNWKHPSEGLLPGESFMPLAEEAGVSAQIAGWIVREACRQTAEWRSEGLADLPVSVKLAAGSFADDNVRNVVTAALAESGLPPELLELELTEMMVMRNPERTVETLRGLKALGVRITMDRFGGGYGSLARIDGFPVDILKVDRSAVGEEIVSVAKTLGRVVVAEAGERNVSVREGSPGESTGFYFDAAGSADAVARALRNGGKNQAA